MLVITSLIMVVAGLSVPHARKNTTTSEWLIFPRAEGILAWTHPNHRAPSSLQREQPEWLICPGEQNPH